MKREEVAEDIQDFVKRRFPSPSREVELGTHLFRDGIVDSLGVLELVQFLEKQFGLQIGPDELRLENFQSIEAMCDFVLRAGD